MRGFANTHTSIGDFLKFMKRFLKSHVRNLSRGALFSFEFDKCTFIWGGEVSLEDARAGCLRVSWGSLENSDTMEVRARKMGAFKQVGLVIFKVHKYLVQGPELCKKWKLGTKTNF